MTYQVMDEDGRANVQGIIDQLTTVGVAIGEWTGKTEARQGGASYHATFEHKVPVDTAIQWAAQLEQCPALLADSCRKLLEADARIHQLEATIFAASVVDAGGGMVQLLVDRDTDTYPAPGDRVAVLRAD